MLIKAEGDLRKWMRAQFGQRVFFVEYGIGGDNGFPDCLLICPGKEGNCLPRRTAPIELKVTDLLEVSRAQARALLRPEQDKMGERMYFSMIPAYMLLGFKGQERINLIDYRDLFRKSGLESAAGWPVRTGLEIDEVVFGVEVRGRR